MKRSSRVRLATWFVIPLIVGSVAGLTASKFLWNYFWVQPTVRVEEAVQTVALSVFQREGDLTVLSEQDRNGVLLDQFARCSKGQECTFGRILSALSTDEWTRVGLVPENEIRSILKTATPLTSAPFFREDQNGTGIVATYVANGEPRTLVSFLTWELHADTHGYVELLLSGSGSRVQLLDSVHYFFDVAGIEFATPKVLIGMGIVVAYIIAACAFVTTKLLAARAARSGDRLTAPTV